MQEQFNRMKKEYNQIQAPEKLKKRVEKTMKSKKKNQIIKRVAASFAILSMAGIISLNLSSGLAYAVSEVPGLGDITRIVTFSKYQFQEDGYQAKVEVPEIQGLLDPKMEEELNKEFKKNAQAVIAAFEKDVKELREEFGNETVHMGLEYNYEVKTDNENVLALDIYLFQVAGSSSTVHSFYNIDKKTGHLITLDSLFKKDVDYVDLLSDYVRGEMIRKNKDEDGMFWVDEEIEEWNFKKIKEDQNFYINDSGNLVICFDKYEVAAGAGGSPEFIIPEEIIKNIKI